VAKLWQTAQIPRNFLKTFLYKKNFLYIESFEKKTGTGPQVFFVKKWVKKCMISLILHIPAKIMVKQ
jgi:hypothetical protein